MKKVTRIATPARAQARRRVLPQGPGQFNPTRSVRFADRGKSADRLAARGRTHRASN